jgi:prepilin-type processing-associated H-X9-DG protein
LKYVAGQLEGNGVTGADWADQENYFIIHDSCGDNSQNYNCHNNNEIYSFHKGGCNFSFGDASVHFLTNNLDPDVFCSLFTRAEGDIVPDGIAN